MADQLLDAKGLNCPLPILRAKKALKDVAMGGTLEVLATDPGAVKDFEAFCRATGNELLASEADGKVFSFVIKRMSRAIAPLRFRWHRIPCTSCSALASMRSCRWRR